MRLSTLAGAALIALAGCPKLGELKLPDLSAYTPKVRFEKLDVKKVTFDGVDASFVFQVDNPNPVTLKLAAFTYDLDLAGSDLLSGNGEEGLTLEANGSSPLKLPVSVLFKDAVSVVQGAKGQDRVPFRLSGTMGFDTPLGRVTLPYDEDGQFPVLRPPKFKVEGLRVGKLDLLKQTASIDIDLAVTNDGAAPIGLNAFDYHFLLAGTEVAVGQVAELARAEAGETKVSLPVTLKLLDLGKTVVDALTKKTPVDGRLKAGLKVDTPFGRVPLNIDEAARIPVK